jgi:hypothetical protein
VAYPSRFYAARQSVDHASLIRAEIVGRHVWRNQEVGGFGPRKRLANETRILDIADAALRTSLGQGGQFLSLAADYANLLSPLEQEGRSGAAGISRSSKDANHGHSYLSANDLKPVT